jgi:uridine phosphorylase
MSTWQVDESEPIINPETVLDYYRQLMDCQSEELALPNILVGTFQRISFDYLAERIGDSSPKRWPTPVFWPIARGDIQGLPIAIARLPIGAPAAASALELMIAAGVRTAIIVGSAGSIQPSLPIGSLIVADRALRREGTSYHYTPASEYVSASADLIDGLLSSAQRRGRSNPTVGCTWTTDAPYRECTETVASLRSAGVLCVEMEAAALYTVAAHRGTRIALVAAISDQLHGQWMPGFHTLSYRRGLIRAADLALDAAAQTSLEF